MANGALLNIARQQHKFFLDQGGFQTDLTITSKDGGTTVTVFATVTLHNTQFDPDSGLSVNAKQGHCFFNIQTLEDLGFTVFGSTKNPEKVYLKGATVEFVDGNGKTQKMICDDVRPSETFGSVSIIFGEYK